MLLAQSNCLPGCLWLQDIGESEASELVQLYRPLAEKAVQELLGDVDLSSQGSLEGLDLRDLVREGGGAAGAGAGCHALVQLWLLFKKHHEAVLCRQLGGVIT